MMLYWLQQTGHRPIALMGGGTTRVGDPSGKDESRRLLTDDDIDGNLRGIRAIFAKFLTFGDGPGDAIMANNADWLNTLNYIDFLRDVGRHFSVNRMLTFDSVKLRLERQQELSFLEFNYMILQAYDFVELNKRTGCVLQMGGSDQWGNIVNGIDLGRRHGERAAVRADLAAAHHRLRRQDGQDRGRRGVAQRRHGEPVRLLAVLAQHRGRRRGALPQAVHRAAARRDRAGSRRSQGEEINEAKKVLATEATALVHGRAAADAGRRNGAQDLRGRRARGEPADGRDRARRARRGPRRARGLRAKPASSPRTAKRAARSRRAGSRSTTTAVTDEKSVLTSADLTEGVIKLSLGRKKHVLLKPV